MSERDHLIVLVVEDDFSIRRLLQERLGRADILVHAVGCLADARQALSTHRIDLLVLDLGLPDGDGADFVRELRR